MFIFANPKSLLSLLLGVVIHRHNNGKLNYSMLCEGRQY